MAHTQKLAGGLYGCGMISQYHLEGWKRVPEVEIVALANRTAARAEQRRSEFVPSARVYTDLTSMLACEQLDFVDILTTPELHPQHCLEAKNARLHIICQKPLADTIDAARTLALDMTGYPKLFAIHENHRYRPWFQDVSQRYRRGEFGDVQFLRLEHLNATEPGENYKNEVAEGVWWEYGSHLVDMMRSLLGGPLRVYARSSPLNPRVRGESLFLAMYEYAGCTVEIAVGWKNAALTQGSVLLVGTEGEAWYEGTLTRGNEGRLRITSGGAVVSDTAVSPLQQYADSFYEFERECAQAILADLRVTQTAAEHLRSLECTFAAYESARTGSIVTIA